MESDNAEQPTNASVEPDNPGPKGQGSADGTGTGEGTGEYQMSDGEEVVKFSRPEAKATVEVQRLRKDLDSLKGTLNQERGKRVDAERMAALSQRAEFYTLDPEEEMASCKYGRMSGDQFNDHLLRIERSYQRRPIAHFSRLPTHAPGATEAAAAAPDRPGNAKAREQ